MRKGDLLATKSKLESSETDKYRADIGLVCALPIELGEFFGRCLRTKTYTGGKFRFRGGFYDNIKVVIVESGMGQERARRATSALLDAHSPRWIISAGFCGALIPEIKIGHIVVANQVCTAEGDKLTVNVGMASDLDRGLHVGKTLTVARMVRSTDEKRSLAEQTSSIALDMETHAVAAVCRERKTRFLAVRSVSDDLSADLPAEILSLVGETGAVRLGAAIGALWKRPSSLKDMWRLREQALVAAENLAKFLDGVVRQLQATP